MPPELPEPYGANISTWTDWPTCTVKENENHKNTRIIHPRPNRLFVNVLKTILICPFVCFSAAAHGRFSCNSRNWGLAFRLSWWTASVVLYQLLSCPINWPEIPRYDKDRLNNFYQVVWLDSRRWGRVTEPKKSLRINQSLYVRQPNRQL